MTTTNLEFKQIADLNESLVHRQLNPHQFVGRWLNTNRETQGIAECHIEFVDDRCRVRLSGVGEPGLIVWPAADATMLANLEEEGGRPSIALVVSFSFSFMKVESHIRVNRGVLVLVLFVTFTDNSGRSDYVTREFFYRES
jgi:hypothetical protein